MKTLQALFLALCLTVFSSLSAFAAMAPADEALVLSGLTASDGTFYKIGGAILVVLAGIWGFRKVMGLMGGSK